MNQRKLAPFIHTPNNAPYIYLNYTAALIPSMCLSVAYYGLRALMIIMVSVIMFFACDYFITSKLRGVKLDTDYYDLSSLFNGAVFALLLPPDTPLWIVLLGVLFGSVVIKQLFGGAGNNLVNPPIAARLFVTLVYPSLNTLVSEPFNDFFDVKSLFAFKPVNDGFTLESFDKYYFVELLAGRYTEFLGAGCALMILIGMVFLFYKRILKPSVPIMYMIAVIITYPLINLDLTLPISDTFRSITAFAVTSGTLFIAVFAMSDLTTVPVGRVTKLVTGALCGILTVVMYVRCDHIIALCVPVISVNLLTPVLEYFTDRTGGREGGRRL